MVGQTDSQVQSSEVHAKEAKKCNFKATSLNLGGQMLKNVRRLASKLVLDQSEHKSSQFNANRLNLRLRASPFGLGLKQLKLRLPKPKLFVISLLAFAFPRRERKFIAESRR